MLTNNNAFSQYAIRMCLYSHHIWQPWSNVRKKLICCWNCLYVGFSSSLPSIGSRSCPHVSSLSPLSLLLLSGSNYIWQQPFSSKISSCCVSQKRWVLFIFATRQAQTQSNFLLPGYHLECFSSCMNVFIRRD